MRLKTIKLCHAAVRDDIGSLVTRRALPTGSINMIDPFLFLNHHGPQDYPPNNSGLPFAPHPHRGFETVTFILDGDVAHRDSGGHESVIKKGGVQWMTAGSGLIHEEVSSDEFKKNGGHLEILQLWLNLPAKLKMTQPRYIGLQEAQIPRVSSGEGRVHIDVVSGRWDEQSGAFDPHLDVHLFVWHLKKGAEVQMAVTPERNIFFYVVRGEITVNEAQTKQYYLVEFDGDGDQIYVKADRDAVILFGHAPPINEPVVAHGPFVMNTREEIIEAIKDYQAGKFE